MYLYTFGFIRTVLYMLQNTEYEVGDYFKWLWKTDDFSRVIYRRKLLRTQKVKALLLFLNIGIILQITCGLFLLWLGYVSQSLITYFAGFILIISYPFVWSHLVALPIVIAKYTFLYVYNNILISKSEEIFKNHSGIKVAVAGSYGKTTVKELLATVLADHKKTASTPGNKNVALSHAKFAQTLRGDEDVIIIEYGEGKRGDIAKFARTTHPDKGIITGVAPAHLDKYSNLQEAGEDIFSLAEYLSPNSVYVNGDSADARKFIRDGFIVYDDAHVGEYKITNIKTDYDGLSFTLEYQNKKIDLKSGLLGKHLAGTIAMVAVIGMELGLTDKQVKSAIASTKPYEHRLELKKLHDAWLIDDTYNGNIEGVNAGTQLLKDLPAKRKIYVTPGLVDQGIENENVHVRMGELIAESNPNIVVLMQNSVTDFIKQGLEASNYKGDLRIEEDPLDFYTNISHFIAAGDLVLMQNDWPDNYA